MVDQLGQGHNRLAGEDVLGQFQAQLDAAENHRDDPKPGCRRSGFTEEGFMNSKLLPVLKAASAMT